MHSFFDSRERAALYILAIAGAIALLTNVIVDSAALNIAGGVFVAASFIGWGVAHLVNREWTQPTHGEQQRWVSVVFVLAGFIIIGLVVADLAVA